MADLAFFLFSAVVISLSGVMAPGPMTATAIAAGARSRHAGIFIAIGHAVVEFPLMILILTGMRKLFELNTVRTGIGLAGGTFLLIMALQMLHNLGKASRPVKQFSRKGPVPAGIILSGGNPYFLLWWATVGLTLATKARQLGLLAFGLFAVIHWLCDLVWLEALSWASFKSSALLGRQSQRYILFICSIALLLFATIFLYDAGSSLVHLIADRG